MTRTIPAMLLLLVFGCSQSVPVAPPKVHYGQDLCVLCGMIISEDRYAAAMVCEGDKGLEARIYDDVGCLVDDEQRHPDRTVAGRWVRDFRADRWLEADSCVFVQSRQLHSPMAFGLAACVDRSAAQALAEEFPGELLDLETARRRFEANTLVLAPGRDAP